ncbi:hypothetical protein ACWGI9_37395 [Streptomyces sp. NPDC054833]
MAEDVKPAVRGAGGGGRHQGARYDTGRPLRNLLPEPPHPVTHLVTGNPDRMSPPKDPTRAATAVRVDHHSRPGQRDRTRPGHRGDPRHSGHRPHG